MATTTEAASAELVVHHAPSIDPAIALSYKVQDDGSKLVEIDARVAKRFNLLCPVSNVVQVDPNWSPQLRSTTLVAGQDTYKVGTKKMGTNYPGADRYGNVEVHSLDAPALAKLGEVAGIEHRKTTTKRWQGGMRVEVTARMRGPDGLFTYSTRGRDVDFSDAEELYHEEQVSRWEKWEGPDSDRGKQGKGKPKPTDRELRTAWLKQKEFLFPTLETKAFGRCVKALLKISTFLRPELDKPFLTIGWLMTPNLADPNVRELVKLQYAESVADLYGPSIGDGDDEHLESIEGHLSPADLAGVIADDDEEEGDDEEPSAAGGDDEEPPAAGAVDAESWDDDEDEDEQPPPAKPAESFVISHNAKDARFKGRSVEEVLNMTGGWEYVAKMTRRHKDLERQALGLSWLSWKSGKPVSMDNLEQELAA